VNETEPLAADSRTRQAEPFEASLPPDLARLRGLRKDLAAWLGRIGVSAHDRDAVVLAAHEAAANGIEHAGGRVVVRGARDGDKLLLIVTNTGRWAGGVRTREPGGRGLLLMRGLMSQLDVSVSDDHTTVRMRIDLED
jgi:anti-sigma regulatory factor (Ser/Thr protein kinase)